ncbi:bifunctional phosphoribosyl-AMP cyclohydrolase/phosphoribosyl-ATP diphosphatase HisIE [Helicobacter sp. 16-1353]|uniref:bifunctional phosphoribosyl-AMP cyclohydrolase/phosphoribosyl-ATP diphosphatase HisIE n=1 Tax=Helicobacter sp. 16-1353 TaxID=2004996 RepID=UPI00215B9A87|nr:bifunctional phosphoribosyl-AMP cyclohydrolase/phosphoribosyl-ATP diphosphatase HisIE [Helicobacter sp. 16-1353]
MNIIDWDKSPLIPVIVQDIKDSKILMLAFANKESFDLSLKTSLGHYFSRSKNRIWKKGEESGHFQHIKEIYIDCDNDAILFRVEQVGVPCHTGNPTCFYKKIDLKNVEQNQDLANLKIESLESDKIDIPYNTLDKLYHILQSRKNESSESSYTASLYKKGENTIGKKIAEEAAEFAFALKDDKEGEIIAECADLLYHTLVGLSYRDISPDRVMQELQRRFGMSGLEEKRNRKK